MKKLIFILMLAVGVSAQTVTPPPPDEPVEIVRDIVMVNPPKWRKNYAIDHNTVAANVINSKPVERVDVRIFVEKRPIADAEFDQLADLLAQKLSKFQQQIELSIKYVMPLYGREGTGRYRSTPIRVHTFCTNGFCSSTATGGQVYEQTKQTYKGERVLISRDWKNY